MKGIIFKHFESFVCAHFGEEAFERILESTQLETKPPFLGPGSYPDTDLLALVATAVEQTGIPLADAVHAFGKDLFGHLIRGHENYAEGHDLRSFITSVHDVIHVEVRKLYPGAILPAFAFEDLDNGDLQIEYRSARKLCPLVGGLLEGAAAHFGQPIQHEQTACVHEGAECCTFHVHFESAEARKAS